MSASDYLSAIEKVQQRIGRCIADWTYLLITFTSNLETDVSGLFYMYIYTMLPMHVQSLKLLRPTVSEEMYLQENI